jgi:tetratricopeptide (TPR) repeat protein
MTGRDYYLAGQYEKAIEQCRKTLEIEPDFFPALIHLGKAYREKGMYQQAIDVLSKTSDLSGGRTESISLIGHIHALTGKRAEAQKALDELKERSRHRYVAPYHVAVVYAGLGEKDLAFEWLQKAYVDRNELITFIKFAPEFNKLRSDPRFADLLKRLNLPL